MIREMCCFYAGLNTRMNQSGWMRNAYKSKGPEYIEPVPIDPPSKCPPPEELAKKHFNDNLLYIINAEKDRETIPDREEWTVE